MVNKFNIRVYGIWVKDEKILLTRENIDGFKMTKFPGGGLEYGEGMIEGLEREMMEELQLPVKVLQHIYTSEDFVQSKFRSNEQVVAVYYQVACDLPLLITETSQDTNLGMNNHIRFEWFDLQDDIQSLLSFETDRKAMKCFREEGE